MLHPNKSAPADVSPREDAPRSPTAARPSRYALTASVLRASMEETGCSVRQLAAAIGDGTTTRVESWRDGSKGLTLDALALFPAGLALRVLARLEEQKRGEMESKRATLPVTTHAMRAQTAVGELSSTLLDALADGVIDEKERPLVRKCTLAVINAGEHLSTDLDRAAGGR